MNNIIIETIKEASYRVAKRLGPYFWEDCYKKLLVKYLTEAGVECVMEHPLKIKLVDEDDFLLTTLHEDIWLPQHNLILELKALGGQSITNCQQNQVKYYLQEHKEATAAMLIIFRRHVDDRALGDPKNYMCFEPKYYYIEKKKIVINNIQKNETTEKNNNH